MGHAIKPPDRADPQTAVDHAAVYDALAAAEADDKVAGVYARLADANRARAHLWADPVAADRRRPPAPRLRARLMAFLGRHLAPSMVMTALARGDRTHARRVQAEAARVGGLPGPALAKLEGRRRGGAGNALRAAVLGANDGLVSNLSLVMGVAGAAAAGRTILLTGLAGMVAGSCSMAMGEWLSVNSAREMARRQIDAESRELDDAPEMEKQELALIYQAKGLDAEAAETLADKLFQSKEAARDTLVREELGIDPEELGGSAWAAAISSFCLFAVGAIFPVLAFFFTRGWTAVIISLALSGAALASIGAATSLFTGRSPLFSAGRQLAIGWAAALITFGVGKLIGAGLA